MARVATLHNNSMNFILFLGIICNWIFCGLLVYTKCLKVPKILIPTLTNETTHLLCDKQRVKMKRKMGRVYTYDKLCLVSREISVI